MTNCETEFKKIRLESPASVCDRLAMGNTWLYERLKDDPEFPQPIKIGSSTRFLEHEVNEWIEKKIEKSRSSVIH